MVVRSACPTFGSVPTTLISSPSLPGQTAGYEDGVDDSARDEEREVEVPGDEPHDACGHGEAHDEAGPCDAHKLPVREPFEPHVHSQDHVRHPLRNDWLMRRCRTWIFRQGYRDAS